MTALNPIMPGFNPDPSICRVGSDYFLATSTFEFFPGVPIYHSTDLINWKLICHALSRPSQLNMRAVPMSCGVWAPTLRYNKGRWYMTTTCMQQISSDDYCPKAFYVYTDNIWDEGSWSDPIWTQMHGIDPDLFFDDDDRVYLSSAPVCGPHHGITSDPIPHLITMGCEIDIRTGRSLSPSVILRVSEYGRKIAEGPHIYKIKGWYYLLTAEGGTQEHHRAMITRSKSPLGPYEEPPEGINPLIFNDQDPDVRHTGHADIFEGSDGRWWATCLGIRPQENGVAPLLRETFLTPLEWNEDGWPVIKGKIALDIPADLPKRAKREVWRDDFDQPKLSSGWYHIRTPVGHEYSLTSHPGQLALFPGGFRLDDYECPSALLRKQITLNGVWTTRMHFQPGSAYEEAGSVMYVSAVSYVAMFVRLAREGEIGHKGKVGDAGAGGEGVKRVMVVRYPEGGSGFKEDVRPLQTATAPIEMKIVFSPLSYTFSYTEVISPSASATGGETASAGATEIEMLELTTAALHEPRDLGAFTGPHFGMFAQTINEPGRAVALFDYAQHDFGE